MSVSPFFDQNSIYSLTRKNGGALPTLSGFPQEQKVVVVKKRKRSQQVPWDVRKRIWDMHMGNVKSGPCLLCGMEHIKKNKNNGFEAAHIVANKYCQKSDDPYLLIPSCSTCNNEMGTTNLWDWLYGNGRFKALKSIAWKIIQIE